MEREAKLFTLDSEEPQLDAMVDSAQARAGGPSKGTALSRVSKYDSLKDEQ
jgi:hypothetical protein